MHCTLVIKSWWVKKGLLPRWFVWHLRDEHLHISQGWTLTYCFLFYIYIVHKESSAVSMKPLELSSSLSSRTPSAVPRKSISDNEFENKLNHSRRSTDPINLVTYSSSDLQAATGNFHSSRLLGQGTIGGVYKAKYTDGTVRSYHASINLWQRNLFASTT